MDRFVALTFYDLDDGSLGEDVIVNPSLVTHIVHAPGRMSHNDASRVFLAVHHPLELSGEAQQYVDVVGSPSQVKALLNGETAAPPLKAHPTAVGWIQTPELPQ